MAGAGNRPHIVLITMDELNQSALSCCGAHAVQTPNLDRLAETSVRFERAYTPSPLCLPSRVSIVTGLYPHASAAVSNMPPSALRRNQPSLYMFMRSLGYTAAHIGKCHYLPVPYSQTRPDVTLPYDDFRDHYVSLGMDHLALQDDKQVSVWFYDDYSKELDRAGYLEPYREATWDRAKQKVFEFPGPAEWHPDTWVGRRAVEYLDQYDVGKPLFLWVSFSGPHYPFDPPKEYLDRVDASRVGEGIWREGEFDDPEKIHHESFHGPGGLDGCGPAPDRACKNYPPEYWRRLRTHYFANVAQMDDEVGRILAAVERKLGPNVLTIFTCDHGEMLGNHRLWGKHDCGYEDVIRVPLFVRWPGQTEGYRSDALVSLVDITPTCLAAAGMQPPRMHGRDLRRSIDDGGYSFVFSECSRFAVVTDGRVKYIHCRRRDRTLAELYDLQSDPHEFDNLLRHPGYANTLAALRGTLLEHFMGHALP